MANKKVKPVAKKRANDSGIDIENVCDLILEGKSYVDIAKGLNIGLSKLKHYCINPNHSARVREALKESADSFEEKAEQILLELPSKATQGQIVRARELAQHYRWKASKRDPRRFGDKLDVTSDNKALNNGISITTWVQDNINASTSKR